jgi:hypothetical protein
MVKDYLMNLTAYDDFVEATHAGKKAAAATAAHVFITSFSTFDEKHAWVVDFLKTYQPQDKIRHELYEQLIFPVLLQSYRASDGWGIRWLAATSQNLYRAKQLWAQLDFITEHGLLKQWSILEPESELARHALLEKMIEGFQYSEHEWPAGILYGMNGANLEQCQEIANAVTEARALDVNGKYNSYLTEFQEKLNSYATLRLTAKSELPKLPQ